MIEMRSTAPSWGKAQIGWGQREQHGNAHYRKDCKSVKVKPNLSKESAMDLQCISEFPQRPPAEFVDHWRQHISETGEPETHAGVSTSKPPRTAAVVLLSEDIKVRVSLRAGGERVPCPLCSPTSPKFETGRMAWFPDDAAVRFIGHSCAKKYLGENYVAAERLYKVETACAELLELWPKLQAIRVRTDSIADRLRILSHGMRSTRALIDQECPRFARFLFGELVHAGGRVVTSKVVGAKTEVVKGLDFISDDFHPDKVAARIVGACDDLRTSLPHWRQADGDNHAAAEIIRRGRRAQKCLRELAELRDYVDGARRFLVPSNLGILKRWVEAGLSVFTRFQIERIEDNLRVNVAWWDGAFDVTMPIHSGFDAELPAEAEIEALGLKSLLVANQGGAS